MVGSEEIHCEFLKQLPPKSLDYLLTPLNDISHLQYLKDKCSKALKLICVRAHKDWGADQADLTEII